MAIKGALTFPGDKSISHRALLLAPLAQGKSYLYNLSTGADVAATRKCLQTCGIPIQNGRQGFIVTGAPFHNPHIPLYCGNAGTTVRLLIGLLAGQKIRAQFTGDDSLSKRPMDRVLLPLQKMGLQATSRRNRLPVTIKASHLNGILYSLPVPSAQVKSAILLAGLGADKTTTVVEMLPSRNHTEILLRELGAPLSVNSPSITVTRLTHPLNAFEMTIPGDPSAAAFLATAAVLVPGSELGLNGILLNPTRSGFWHVLKSMSANVEWLRQWQVMGETVGDLKVSTSRLRGITLEADTIPSLIDELPLLALLATQAEGETTVRGAGELRVKESDRIQALVLNLRRMGAAVEELKDGFHIEGPTPLQGANIQTFGDHRIAMTFAIGGLIAEGPVHMDDPLCMSVSFPQFHDYLQRVAR